MAIGTMIFLYMLLRPFPMLPRRAPNATLIPQLGRSSGPTSRHRRKPHHAPRPAPDRHRTVAAVRALTWIKVTAPLLPPLKVARPWRLSTFIEHNIK